MLSNKQLANKIKTKAFKDLSEQSQVVMTRLKDNADDDRAFIEVLLEIDVALELSDFFETKLYKEIKHKKLHKVLSEAVQKIYENLTEEEQQTRVNELTSEAEKQGKLISIIMKRAFDCINRHSEVEKKILHSVLTLETISYERLTEEQHDKITSTMKKVATESALVQLDLALLHAAEKYFPLPEVNNIIDVYGLESTELYNLWQSANHKYKEAHGVDVFVLDTEIPHIAKNIFEKHSEQVDTKEKLYKNLDTYGSLFLKDETIRQVLKSGGAV
jgi:hypothetical protein